MFISQSRKGIATPIGSGSGNTSVAAWKDPIDLYCVKHTKYQTVMLAMMLENWSALHSQASTLTLMLPLTLGVVGP